MSTVLFFVFALLAVSAAWGVVTNKNIVHSALLLALSFVGVAALYVMLNAEFLAAVQVLVYMGAVAIMVIFSVMLTLRGDVRESSPETRKWPVGLIGAALMFVVLLLVILGNGDWRILAPEWNYANTTADLSTLILTKYMIPFETAAILLTVALIGAIILAKGGKASK